MWKIKNWRKEIRNIKIMRTRESGVEEIRASGERAGGGLMTLGSIGTDEMRRRRQMTRGVTTGTGNGNLKGTNGYLEYGVWGGNLDRRNEMIARGFDRNTYWKEIKEKVEEVIEVSGITYDRVKVIGEKASFAIINFDHYESKKEFKKWLSRHGEEVKRERWMWFGDNVDKRTWDREIAVGLVVKALKTAREGRNDVYRDYKEGKVWVGNDFVARWEGMSDVMNFWGGGKNIRASYKALRVREWREEEEEFSE